MAELRADLRPLYGLRNRWVQQFTQAISRIKQDLVAERIEAWGRPVQVGGDGLGEYEKVPASFFEPKSRTITLDGKAWCDPNASLDELGSTEQEWHELQFRRPNADRLYRPIVVGDQGIPGSASSRIARFQSMTGKVGAVTLAELPAYWTFGQAIAWIMFRDPSLVARADSGHVAAYPA
jgi:hypothetical protein